MVCYCNASTVHPQSGTNCFCAAKAMEPRQRQDLALQALAGAESIRGLATEHAVSRKFIYQQVDTAKEALQEAFAPEQDDATKVLFYLPVTKQWLEQAFLGLTLICHSSIRGISEFCRDLLDYPVSVGKVHNVLQAAVGQARAYNRQQDLSGVRIGAHDEIFQSGWPVLVGADVRSSFCYLLSREEQRDAETWAIRMLELQDRGFRPEATIADAGSGLRAGQALAMPGTPCRGDVFHALQLVQPLVTFLENRAYEAIAHEATLAHKSQKAQEGPHDTAATTPAPPAEQRELCRTTSPCHPDQSPGHRSGRGRGHVVRLAASRHSLAGRCRLRHTPRTVRLCGGRTAGSSSALPTPHCSGRQRLDQPG